jgi:hypothetical protein
MKKCHSSSPGKRTRAGSMPTVATKPLWTSVVLTLILLTAALGGAQAQDTSTPPATGGTPDTQTSPGSSSSGANSQDTNSQTPQQPIAPYGQDNPAPVVTENPPITGIDTPSLEPHSAPLSYLQPGVTASESVITNGADVLGGSGVNSISRALASMTLQRLWSHYDLALDYVGGVGYYDVAGQGFKLLQQLDFQQKVTWKRGELAVRDSFSYLPEGNFGAAYGALGSQSIASLGSTAFSSFWGNTALGTLGLAPRIMNLSMADASEYLSPKSAVTAAGGYALTHFYGDDEATGTQFIGNSEVSAQVGYDRVVSTKTQIALMGGYQGFDFTEGTAFHSWIIQAMYGYRISGRMDFLIGAGPQFTDISETETYCSNPLYPVSSCTANGGSLETAIVKDQRIGAAGRVRLRYQFSKFSTELTYERFETSGSGFFAGAQTDIARFVASRPLSRVWQISADLGYERSARIQPATPGAGVDANTYSYGFAGVAVHRAFSHNFYAYASYQFNELAFDSSYCGSSAVCNRISNRNVGTIGFDWTPRPIRLD